MYWGWNYIWSNFTLHSEIGIPTLELSGVLVSIAHCWDIYKLPSLDNNTYTYVHVCNIEV